MMLKGLSWAEQTKVLIEQSKAEEQRLDAELKGIQASIQKVAERIQALQEALRVVTDNMDTGLQAGQKDLASMSVNNALIEIAKEHGGFVVTKEAIGILTKAGVFSTRGEANDNIHSVLRRSPRFQRERQGVYRLLANGKQKPMSRIPSLPGKLLSDILAPLEREHPTWEHQDFVKAVIASGYDFGDKNPGLAVNMARQRNRRRVHNNGVAKQPLLSFHAVEFPLP